MFWSKLSSVMMVRNEVVNSMFWSSFGFQDSAGLTLLPPFLPVCTKTRLYPISFSKSSWIIFFCRNTFSSPTSLFAGVKLPQIKLSQSTLHSTFFCYLFCSPPNFFSVFSYCCNINFPLCSIKAKAKKCYLLPWWSFWVACNAKMKALPSP